MITNPVRQTEAEIDEAVRRELLHDLPDEGQVIVHLTYYSHWENIIRIWPTTYLVPQDGGDCSKLLTTHGITLYPAWTLLDAGERFRFTLVFAPLPKTCTIFDLQEDIPEPGGFFISGIKRNQTDVYHLRLT
jgi:hypothetical protein